MLNNWHSFWFTKIGIRKIYEFLKRKFVKHVTNSSFLKKYQHFTCESFDSASFEKSWRWISSVIFKFIILDDFMVGNGVPTDPNTNVCGHIWWFGRLGRLAAWNPFKCRWILAKNELLSTAAPKKLPWFLASGCPNCQALSRQIVLAACKKKRII